MIGFITDLLGGLWPKLVLIGGIVASAIGAVWKLRRDAVRLDRAKREKEDRDNARRIEDAADQARRDADADRRPVDGRLRDHGRLRDD